MFCILFLYSHIQSAGYVGDPTFLKTVVAVVNDLKQVNPDILYVCDPVMGDNGAFYVPEASLYFPRLALCWISPLPLPDQSSNCGTFNRGTFDIYNNGSIIA